ncbi:MULTISPECIES: hypothetical protein [unclassified Micromonospora]|uniref:hypothetical protein n=1 Tax=unclassified Micromonospora TaxID=2617518 RepID=UPI001C5E9F39|nr:hypothetical protein [Micromonospora sp. RL09-050-HVF-A]MBW4702694.1 hypothetical protein [Micromonospora sp. RL09-050-HVF-A]
MPAKRSPKKSRPVVPSPVEVDPAALAALTVTPAHPVPVAVTPPHPDALVRSNPPRPPSRSGRSVRAGSTAAQGQGRRYAFRRS